jgi:hypothetical protein
MAVDSKCKFFDKMMEFMKHATGDNLEPFLLYVMNKGREFYADPSMIQSFLL